MMWSFTIPMATTICKLLKRSNLYSPDIRIFQQFLIFKDLSKDLSKAKGLILVLGALLKIRAPDLSNPSKPPKKELTSAKNRKYSDAAKQRSPGLGRDKAEARRRNHLSYTMIPPATSCSPLCYCEAPKRIGLTMVSILAAISSAGTRFGD
jgi:hypothetical protein